MQEPVLLFMQVWAAPTEAASHATPGGTDTLSDNDPSPISPILNASSVWMGAAAPGATWTNTTLFARRSRGEAETELHTNVRKNAIRRVVEAMVMPAVVRAVVTAHSKDPADRLFHYGRAQLYCPTKP